MQHAVPMKDTLLEVPAVRGTIAPSVRPVTLSPALRPFARERCRTAGISAHAEPVFSATDPLALVHVSTGIALRAAAVPLPRLPAPRKLPAFERRGHAEAIRFCQVSSNLAEVGLTRSQL